MCGITGWVDWQRDLSQSMNIIKTMTQTLSKRGPDDEGYFLEPRLAFGHRRLIVVDPQGGLQPMVRKFSGRTYAIVYNGELYNTEELRLDLKNRGYHFQGHSDTEVLLTAYIEWGAACAERLNGIFAYGIWDSSLQQLVLTRDRFGVKPLFYYELPGSLLFASEPKALLAHPEIEEAVDRIGLSEIFLLGPSRTPGNGIYCGMNELKPAHTLIFTKNEMKLFPYWHLAFHPHVDDFETTSMKVRELCIDTINRQFVSDVPIGTFLSGGLDSSIITAVAAKIMSEKNQDLMTFSVDYLDNEKYFRPTTYQPNSDQDWIRKVSQYCGTHHQECIIDTPELVDALYLATDARDCPGMADIDSSLLLFAKDVKNKVTVSLSGECADEVFGGYPWFSRPECIRAETFPWMLQLDHRLQVLSPELIDWLQPQQFIQERYRQTLDELAELEESSTSSDIKHVLSEYEKRQRQIAYLTLTRFMPTLLDRKDRMSMAAGLEVRVPFCDHRIVDYVWNIPWSMKAWQGREKGLLREAFKGLLPADVLWRKKSPYPKTHHPGYLQAVRQKLTEIIEDNTSPLIPFVNRHNIRALIKRSDTLPAGQPWFGQLMDIPQLFAYLIQIDYWLKKYHIRIR